MARRLADAIDIISHALVGEEGRYFDAKEKGGFYSNCLVNRMREFFGLPELPALPHPEEKDATPPDH